MKAIVTVCLLALGLIACATKQESGAAPGGANNGAPFAGNWVVVSETAPLNLQLAQSGSTVSGSATLADVSADDGYAWLAQFSGCNPTSGSTGTGTLNGQTVPTLSLTVNGCGTYALSDGELTTGTGGEEVIEAVNGSWFAFQPTWSNFSVTANLFVMAKSGQVGEGQAMPVQISLTNNGDGTASMSVLPLPPSPWECTSAFQATGNLMGGSFVSGAIKLQYMNIPAANKPRVITVNVNPVQNCDDSQGEIYLMTGSF